MILQSGTHSYTYTEHRYAYTTKANNDLAEWAKYSNLPGHGISADKDASHTGGILYGQRVAESVLNAPQVGCDADQAVLPHLCI